MVCYEVQKVTKKEKILERFLKFAESMLPEEISKI